VCNAETFTRQAVEKIAGNRLAGCKADAVDEAVEFGPGRSQVGEELVDLRVVAHIAIKNQLRIEVRCEFGDTVLETLADIAEGEFRPLCVACLGNAICDRTVAQYTRDQQFFSGQKTHEVAS